MPGRAPRRAGLLANDVGGGWKPSCADGGIEIIHIVASIANEASGPSYSVPALCQALANQGREVTLMSVGRSERRLVNNCSIRTFSQDYCRVPILRKLMFSRELRLELQKRTKQRAILHVHGLWLMPNIYPGAIARARGVPLIFAPRGMLGPEALQFSQHRKQIMWHLLQKRAVSAAACLHATSEQEYEEIRQYGLRQPVAVVPNGIDVPVALARRGTRGMRTVLYLGRIHPKKGLDRLVAAWQQIEPLRPDWTLRIVGPDENRYRDRLKQQALSLGLRRIVFADPLFGDLKREAYQAAEIVVLPTLNENFGMTVAEALAHGTPVICTKGAPWEGLETNACGWWIDQGVASLSNALNRATSIPSDELIAMGNRGRDWMARDFSWTAIASKMAAVYSWLSANTSIPTWVRTV